MRSPGHSKYMIVYLMQNANIKNMMIFNLNAVVAYRFANTVIMHLILCWQIQIFEDQNKQFGKLPSIAGSCL